MAIHMERLFACICVNVTKEYPSNSYRRLPGAGPGHPLESQASPVLKECTQDHTGDSGRQTMHYH